MDVFVWDQRFVTGLDTVDSQHRHLVDLVNQVGDFLLENSGDEAALQAVFGELATYALEHFAEEEKLMADLQVNRARMRSNLEARRASLSAKEAADWFHPALGERATALTHQHLQTLAGTPAEAAYQG